MMTEIHNSLTLHLGIHRIYLDIALDEIRREVSEHDDLDTIHQDGDGWLAWGEAPGTDANDEDTMHVQVTSESLVGLVRLYTYLHSWGVLSNDERGGALTSSRIWSALVMTGEEMAAFAREHEA